MRPAATEPAAPCGVCGTTGGFRAVYRRTPNRTSLRPFGADVVACHACYNTARYRFKVGRDVLTGERPAPAPPARD